MNDSQLYKIYEKYIDVPVYRVQSDEYTKDMKKHGLNPKKDPFLKIRPKLEEIHELILKLEKQGYKIEQNWGGKIVSGSYSVRVTRDDLDSPFIDFTPYWEDAKKFNKQWTGGALVTNTKELCEIILKLNTKLTPKEKRVVDFMYNWADKKMKYKNRIIVIRGSSKVFETAHFQHHYGRVGGERYWVSPYGSFDNFKKVVGAHGIERYLPFFKRESIGHLRVVNKISAREIKVLR